MRVSCVVKVVEDLVLLKEIESSTDRMNQAGRYEHGESKALTVEIFSRCGGQELS